MRRVRRTVRELPSSGLLARGLPVAALLLMPTALYAAPPAPLSFPSNLPGGGTLPAVPGIGELLGKRLPPSIFPATSFDIPTPYGGAAGQVAAGLDLESTTSIGRNTDGTAAIGAGLGNPRRLGIDLGVNIFDLDPRDFGRRGSLDLKLHHRIGDGAAAAVGVQNALIWGGSDDPTRFYAMAARRYNLKANPDASFSRIYVTAGLEHLVAGSQNGKYQKLADRQTGQTGAISLVGSAAVRVARPVNAFMEWTGQFLDVGVSIAPSQGFPLVITPALLDVTGRAGTPARVNIGFSSPFSLVDWLQEVAHRTRQARYAVDLQMVDAAANRPLPGGRISITPTNGKGRSIAANHDGIARTALDLPVGAPNVFRIDGTAPGYAPARVSTVLTAGGPNQVTLRLRALLGAIAGTVTESDSGALVSNAEVILMPTAGGEPVVHTTGADGKYRFDGLAPGRFTVRFHKPGYGDLARDTEVKEDQVAIVDFAAQAERGGIVGHVVDEAGQPVAGATITVTSASGAVVATRETPADGSFAEPLAAGDYRISVTAAGYQPAVTPVTTPPGQLQNVTITLHKAP